MKNNKTNKIDELKKIVETVINSVVITNTTTSAELREMIYHKLFQIDVNNVDVDVADNFKVNCYSNEYNVYSDFMPFVVGTKIYKKAYKDFYYGTVVENNNFQLTVLVTNAKLDSEIKVGDLVVVQQHKCDFVLDF